MSITQLVNTNNGADSMAVINRNFTDLSNAPEGTMYNGRILPSVTSNNLTVALKTLAGTDPSASDPVYVMIGGVVRSITGALSFTTNAGSNLLNMGSAELATKEVDLFSYLFSTTTGVGIGFARFPNATVYGDFTFAGGEKNLINIGGYDANSIFVNIGRFAATLSAGAGYTWSVPTFTARNLIQAKERETKPNTYLPAFTSDGGAFTNAPTVVLATYQIKNNICSVHVEGNYNATSGGSGRTTFTTPFLPITAGATGQWIVGKGYNIGGLASLGVGLYESGGVYFSKYDGTTNIANSGQFAIDVDYPI